MIIEITGTNTKNKGAELMLCAIVQHLKEKTRNQQLTVNQHFGSFDDRARYGLRLSLQKLKFGRSSLATKIMPTSMKELIGLSTKTPHLVLDASGFAFSDSLPLARIEEFASYAGNLKKRNIPLILLPQALGPFNKPRHKEAFQRIADASTYIFARDSLSHSYAKGAIADTSGKLKISPDITTLLESQPSKHYPEQVIVFPNQRMIEYQVSTNYVGETLEVMRLIKHLGKSPVLMAHDINDLPIIQQLREAEDIDVLKAKDALSIKRRIGESHLVIGSRFHALVSALSQGVPSIAMSWSHKYEELFRAYDCTELVAPDIDSLLGMTEDLLTRDLSDLKAKLLIEADLQKQQVKNMWEMLSSFLV